MNKNVFSLLLKFLTIMCFVLGQNSYAQDASDASNLIVNETYDLLTHKSREKRAEGIATLVSSDAPRQGVWIEALMQGEMYRDKELSILVIAKKNGRELDIFRADTGEAIATVKKRRVKRISVDNRMRNELRNLLSTQDLENKDKTVRLAAIDQLLKKPNTDLAERVSELADAELDPDVKAKMNTFVSIARLRSDEPATQLAAIDSVSGSLNPIVRSQLSTLASSSEVPEVAFNAKQVLSQIDKKLMAYKSAETVFFGLSLGSVLVLAAIGLAITFGVMGVINMAHGELIMLGAYTTWAIQSLLPNSVEWSLFLAIPVAFVVSGGTGVLIERTIIRHLYGRPLETLLATFGVSLLLQQLVRTLISSNNVAVSNPSWMSGSFYINEALSLTMNRVVIFFFCLMVFATLFLFLKRSAFGLQMRAVSQNRRMARAMGIRSSRIDAMTFGLGAGIAGIAGVALSQITNVGPNLGRDYIIDSFLVVVFGGVGNLWGTLVAGMSLGIFNKVLEPWAGAVLAKVLVLIFIILFIQKRPRGLFPQRGRAAEA